MENVNKIRADNLEREADALKKALREIISLANSPKVNNAVEAGRVLERIKTMAQDVVNAHDPTRL